MTRLDTATHEERLRVYNKGGNVACMARKCGLTNQGFRTWLRSHGLPMPGKKRINKHYYNDARKKKYTTRLKALEYWLFKGKKLNPDLNKEQIGAIIEAVKEDAL